VDAPKPAAGEPGSSRRSRAPASVNRAGSLRIAQFDLRLISPDLPHGRALHGLPHHRIDVMPGEDVTGRQLAQVQTCELRKPRVDFGALNRGRRRGRDRWNYRLPDLTLATAKPEDNRDRKPHPATQTHCGRDHNSPAFSRSDDLGNHG